jgi:hypothetical protein
MPLGRSGQQAVKQTVERCLISFTPQPAYSLIAGAPYAAPSARNAIRCYLRSLTYVRLFAGFHMAQPGGVVIVWKRYAR